MWLGTGSAVPTALPKLACELLREANRMNVGATRVDLRPEDERGIFGSVQTIDDARQ